jgi:NTE family protein
LPASGSYQAQPTDTNFRKGAYWGIRSDIRSYNVANVLACPLDRTSVLAATPTRLKRLDDERQEQLINWGYAVCDAALRAHADPMLPRPSDFPFPAAKVQRVSRQCRERSP